MTGNKEAMNVSKVATVEELLFDVTVAPAVSLAVTTPSPATPSPVERAFGEVSVNLLHGDCLAMMKTLEDNSVHSVVTDPPYGLAECSSELITRTMVAWATGDREFIPEGRGFMGKGWDAFVPPPAVWDEVYRVLKPGGHVLAFAGSRTQDLMALSIRLAGFTIKDSIFWNYGSGFPKSMSIDKAIDKAAGVEREVVGQSLTGSSNKGVLLNEIGGGGGVTYEREFSITAPATDEAKQWEGWGTALKPAHEPIILARKPLSERTIAGNVLKHGTGGLNIDGSRIGTTDTLSIGSGKIGYGDRADGSNSGAQNAAGRFPANVIFDEFTAGILDEQSGVSKSSPSQQGGEHLGGVAVKTGFKKLVPKLHDDQGGASRFFKVIDRKVDEAPPFYYSAKAGKKERPVVNGIAHPTVKPLSLLRYLVKLVTPEGGTCLEPFAGSGTTVEACIIEGFDVVAVEREADYIPLIEYRVARQLNGGLS